MEKNENELYKDHMHHTEFSLSLSHEDNDTKHQIKKAHTVYTPTLKHKKTYKLNITGNKTT